MKGGIYVSQNDNWFGLFCFYKPIVACTGNNQLQLQSELPNSNGLNQSWNPAGASCCTWYPRLFVN